MLSKIAQDANAIAGLRKTGGPYSYKGQMIGDINAVHRYLMNAAKQKGVNLNPQWLWVQLGNTANQSYNPTL